MHALDLVHGTVDILILRTLAWGAMHGYGISRFIRQRTDGAIAIENAALYQALHRLERKKWIKPEWRLTDTNRRAKFYDLTQVGRDQLQNEYTNWRAYVDAVGKLLEPI